MKIVQLITDNREAFHEYDKLRPWFGTAPEALLQGFSELKEAQVHIIGCTKKVMTSPDKLAENIWFHSLHVPQFGWLRTGYQGCIRAARKKIHEINPDIVHAQGTERDCSVSAIFSGYPNIITIHGNMRLISALNRARPLSYQWVAARLEEFTIPRTDGVLCITNYTRAAVAKQARRTWVLPNAVDASFFEIQPSPGKQQTILCVGNISPRKNQNNFVRALDELAAARKFRVIFLGMINAKEAYGAEFLQLLKSRPWCSFEGFADREKLKTYFQEATLLMLPSLEDNCPMVVLEAMAAGVPVIAPKVGGVPDLIDDKKTGLFCDPFDSSSMRNTAAYLLDNPSIGHQLARAARQKAIEHYHPLQIARQHLKIYREVLKTAS